MNDRTAAHDDTPNTAHDDTSDTAPEAVSEIAARVGDVAPHWSDALAPDFVPSVASMGGVGIGHLAPEVATGIASIREGHALHTGSSTLLDDRNDGNLALLVGDWCYADGLCDIAANGDIDTVATLAHLIADLSAYPERDPEARWVSAVDELQPA